MAYITETSDLLNGVGEFPPMDEHTLLSLLPEAQRKKGLGGGAMTPYHTSAWERVNRAFNAEGIDPEDITDDEATDKLKAISCHWIMAQLNALNAGAPDDMHSMQAKHHKEMATNIQRSLWHAMASGKVAQSGKGIELNRG